MGIGRWIIAGVGLAAAGGAVAYAQYRDTEEPDYDVLFGESKFEIRQYAPMIVAEVSHTGARRRAQSASFRRLAAYIFGQDRPEGGEKIEMTAPVFQSRAGEPASGMPSAAALKQGASGEWRMRFVMPAKYTMATLPTPPVDIALEEVPARRLAAIRFAGVARETDLTAKETRLRQWIESQGYQPAGDVEYAFYDAPMVPGPLRRNEVLIPVKRK